MSVEDRRSPQGGPANGGAVEIKVAKSAGFCFGVRDAFNIALEAAHNDSKNKVYMLGHIVHNEHVVKQVVDAGIKVVDDLSDVPASSTLVIRAHGTVPEAYELAKQQSLSIIDATCPLVNEIHKVAISLQEEGYQIIVIGDHGHDEVVGLVGYLKKPIIVATPEEVNIRVQRRYPKIGVVCQSTQDIENVQEILALLSVKCKELRFVNTICPPTTQHQRDIRIMPKDVGIMIIVGSFTSANTCRLTSISKKINPHTYQVESAEDIKPEWFIDIQSVGVTGGASTPDNIIENVVHKIKELTGSTEPNISSV